MVMGKVGWQQGLGCVSLCVGVRLSRLVCVRVCVCLCVGDEAEQDWVHKTNANKTETRNAVRKGGRTRLDVAWRECVMVPQRDQIQIWIRRADTPTVPIQSWGHTQIRQRYTQARTGSETERPAPLDADGNDKPDKPSYQPAGYAASRLRSPRTESSQEYLRPGLARPHRAPAGVAKEAVPPNLLLSGKTTTLDPSRKEIGQGG